MNNRRIILGTMNFGIKNNLDESKSIVNAFVDKGYNELDTAYVYNNGDSEKYLGEIIQTYSNKLIIGTKVNPKVYGNLNKESIIKQVTISLERMKLDAIDILYIHFPDRNTSLEEIYLTCNDLYQQGKIKELGLSNHSAEMVKEICELCKENGWLLPTVYEGMYNALARKAEIKLFDVLRKYDIRFNAYNPLAGGLLSGRYLNYNEKPSTGRFQERPNYLIRYWKESFFNNINILNDSVKKLGLSLAEASLMWLSNHSKLNFSKGDGIIIGVSNLRHLEYNIYSILNDKLNCNVTKLFEMLWHNVEKDSPNYYRYYDERI